MSPSEHDDGLGPSTSAPDARLGASRHRLGTLPFLSSKGLIRGVFDDPGYCDWRSPPRSVAHQVIRAISSAPALGLDLPSTVRRLACRIPDASPPSFNFRALHGAQSGVPFVGTPAGIPLFPVRRCYFWTLLNAQCETRPIGSWLVLNLRLLVDRPDVGIDSGPFSALIRPHRRRSLKPLLISRSVLWPVARRPSPTILVQTRVGHIRRNAHPSQAETVPARGPLTPKACLAVQLSSASAPSVCQRK